MLCYLNGEFVPRATAAIPVEDRGFNFGDGVYEVWRVVEGRLFEVDRHLARLHSGLRELRIAEPPIADRETLIDVADRVIAGSDLTGGEATLYLEITRGVAPRGHAFPAAQTRPTVFVMANRLAPQDALRARGTSVVTMPDVRWLRCDIKTIQLLPNVFAKQAAAERGATEAMLIRDGVVTEGSHSNIFGVFGGVVRTHPLSNLILPGITRAIVIELARSIGVPIEERAFGADEISEADELFLAATTADVMPIVRVDDRSVGTGRPGEITMRLYEAFRLYMEESLAAAASRGVATNV